MLSELILCSSFVPRRNAIAVLRAQSEPGSKRGELFVLRPRRAERFAELRDAPQKHGRLSAQPLLRAVQKFFFLDANGLQAAACCCTRERLAEMLSIGGVNQRMRRNNVFKTRKRSS